MQRIAIEIIYDILEAALTAQTKTGIVARLYNKQATAYLAILVRAGLLEMVEDRTYKTTGKGSEFI